VIARALLLSLLVWGADAHAQDLDLAWFRPALGATPALSIPAAQVAPRTSLSLGVAADYAHEPLAGVVDGLASVELVSALAWRGALEVGVGVPLAAANASTGERVGVGDVRVAFTAPMLREVLPFAFTMTTTLPTAIEHTWSGARALTVSQAFVAEKDLGATTLSGQLGFLLRRRATAAGHEQDDALLLALGLRHALSSAIDAVVEARLLADVAGRTFTAADLPMELDAGLHLPGPWRTRVTLGGGVGGPPTDRGVGAPLVRVLAAVRGSFDFEVCTTGDEDVDGFEDHDGCADLDDDADGLWDSVDACGSDPEDVDGFADDDGCLDLDDDADGLRDADDMCPRRSEDSDGYQDHDGCPEPDNDGDSVLDGRDLCRLEPEDRDQYQDDDGCPEPGPGRTTVTVEGSRVLLSDRIYFEDDADALRAVSAPMLDELSRVLPPLLRNKRLRVEGHTDDSGRPDLNLDLSYRRAKAVVEYLKARGVPADRLEHVGRGAQAPLAPNDTPEGRALNRRVELHLVDP
jgi:outer membrane protein OmpA-like peptidoglycan-associated protein